ncbi:Neuralized-like protein 4, partial [Armadillidium vulgare]
SKGEEGTISVDGNLCFCETCHKIRGDESFHTKGNPPKQYAQPVGWCRFSLVTAVGENNESWHMAYHGIKGGAIRRMLDKGELLFAGNPPKQYAQPVGWCRFSLVTAVGENNELAYGVSWDQGRCN